MNEPLVGSEPVQPPEAVQAVALLELQVRVAVPPAVMVVGVAPNVTLGATLADVADDVVDDDGDDPPPHAASIIPVKSITAATLLDDARRTC